MSVNHGGDLHVLGSRLSEDRLVGEAGQCGFDVMPLAHLEVLAEVLVTAPPVKVNHIQALVSAHLMEVRVPHIVLNPVGRVSTVTVCLRMSLVRLTNAITPVVDQLLFLVFDHDPEEERAPQVENHKSPKYSNTVLLKERIHLPVYIAKWVLHQPGDVLEGSPALSLISRLLCLIYKLSKIAISVLSQRSKQQKKYQIRLIFSVFKPFSMLTCRSCQRAR